MGEKPVWRTHGLSFLEGSVTRCCKASMFGDDRADARVFFCAGLSEPASLRRQLVEQAPGLLQVERIETLGEPAID